MEQGFLQEANRQFFHPLGLALSVKVGDDGSYELDSIWDYREDPEGIIYDLKNSDAERIERFRKNSEYIYAEHDKRESVRDKVFGADINTGRYYGVEPIPEPNKKKT